MTDRMNEMMRLGTEEFALVLRDLIDAYVAQKSDDGERAYQIKKEIIENLD